MRILLRTLGCIWNIHLLEALDGFLLRLFTAQMPMLLYGLDDLLPDLHRRIHTGHRILEDHRDVLSTNLLHVLFGGRNDILATQSDLAVHDLRRRHRIQLHDGLCRHGFTAAGLTDDSEHLAFIHMQRDAADSLYLTGIGEEGDL